jgi:hypothetical protein
MSKSILLSRFLTVALVLGILCSASFALADIPGEHPAYLHALTDLRAARWHLNERGGSDKLKESDHKAVDEIDHCIDEIKKAAIDDGKDLNDHPAEDAGKDKEGHVHRARELLEKSKKDISEHESDQFAKGLRHRAIHHLDEALKHVKHSLEIKQ